MGKMMKKTTIFFLITLFITGCSSMEKQDTENFSFKCPDKPNCVSSKADDKAHKIEPIRYSGDYQKAMDKIYRIIKSFPRSEIKSKTNKTIHAIFKSVIFRFKDDLFIEVDEENMVINIKSASRTGYSDFEVNRKRVEKIKKLFASKI